MKIRLRWRSLPQIHLNFPSLPSHIQGGEVPWYWTNFDMGGGGGGARNQILLQTSQSHQSQICDVCKTQLYFANAELYKAWVCEYKYRSYPFLLLCCCTRTPGQTLTINLARCSKTCCVVLPWQLRSSFTSFLFLNWRSSEPSLRSSGVRLTQVGQQSVSLGEHLAFKVPPWLSLRPT